jgi:uncharacterized protein (DUF2336 family)
MPSKNLTEEDVANLLNDSSGASRAETAAKIAHNFSSGELSDHEREMAQDIFRIMVKDAEVRVREALSLNLKENPNLPHDVAVSLARDVESVSLPVLQFSEVLSDEDLIEIVRSQDPAKQVAIAQRTSVSESVSSVLVDTENADVVSSLVANEGADISEDDLQRVVDEFGENEAIKDAMVFRPKLPVTVAERLLNTVSEKMKEELAKRHDIGDDLATDLIMQSRERAVIGLSSEGDETDLEKLIHQLHQNQRLTPSIMLRALCMGDIDFFEHALAELIGISVINTRVVIHDSGPLGLKAAFKRAAMPESYFPAARAAIDVARETEYDGGENDRERYSRRMIERILTQYGDLGVEFDSEDLEYLLKKMGDLPADSLNNAA